MNPKVSIVIPTKDNVEYLRKCIESIIYKQNYDNYEIIIISNNTERLETSIYFKKIEKNPKISIITHNIEFNYSKLNNYGVNFTNGEYLLFLNDDVELIDPNTIYKFISISKDSKVGIVGATLLYEDDTIQHIGVNIFETNVYHPFKYEKVDNLPFIEKIREVSSVTGACIFIETNKFKQVSGFNEKLEVLYNDIDLCLKIRELGFSVLCTTDILIYHYESKSREVKSYPSDWSIFSSAWINFIEKGDPFDITQSINEANICKLKNKINEKSKIYIWGVGARALKTLKLTQKTEIEIVGFIDNNTSKWGTKFNSLLVYNIDSLKKDKDKNIFLVSIQQYPSVKKQLEQLGYKESRDFIQIY